MLDPQPRTWSVKVVEAFRAVQLENHFTKDELLTLYLNIAPYGGNVRGAEAAARTYFNKAAKHLTVEEAALLAAIPQSPEQLRPDRHADRALVRRDYAITRMLLVDVSGSQAFGTRTQLKRDLVTEIGATLAFSATRNNDKIGLIAFSDEIERHIPATKGSRHVLRIIRELLTITASRRGTDLAGALRQVNHTLRRRSVIFIISDFLSENFETELRIARRRHGESSAVGRSTALLPQRHRSIHDAGFCRAALGGGG